MKNNKIFVTTLLIASTLTLSACGNSAASASEAETEKNQVVESTITADMETSIAESSTTENVSADKQGEISGYEVKDEVEDDLANFPIIDPNFNGAGHTGTLEETVQSYITYEDIDPVTMYVINNTNGERYSTYHDPNVSEGELYASGLVDANQELIIDGKATYNGTDYYRIAFQEEMMLNHQIIILADLVTSELQETPVVQPEVQKPVEQQPTQQQPEVQQQPTQTPPPASENNAPEWDASLGVSKEDWDAFFGGGNTTGQHTWTPDHGSDYHSEKNENGGFTISGGIELTDEEKELLGKLTWE